MKSKMTALVQTITEFTVSNLESLKLSRILKFFQLFLTLQHVLPFSSSSLPLLSSFLFSTHQSHLQITPSLYYCQSSVFIFSGTRNETFKIGGEEGKTLFSTLPFYWPSLQVCSQAHTPVPTESFIQNTSHPTHPIHPITKTDLQTPSICEVSKFHPLFKLHHSLPKCHRDYPKSNSSLLPFLALSMSEWCILITHRQDNIHNYLEY